MTEEPGTAKDECSALTAALKPRLHDTTCCQTGCQTGLTTDCVVYTNIQPVVQPGFTTG